MNCCDYQCNQGRDCPARVIQASRDAGCCSFDPTPDDAPRGWERLAYWACVGLATGCTIGVVFGTAGYLSVKLWGVA